MRGVEVCNTQSYDIVTEVERPSFLVDLFDSAYIEQSRGLDMVERIVLWIMA